MASDAWKTGIRTLALGGGMLCWCCLCLANPTAWVAGPPVFTPGPEGAFDAVAVKDPSIVRHDGKWHLFYTARGQDGYSLGYAAAPALEALDKAPRHCLEQLRGKTNGYAAAPQVFYFAPDEHWYLVYQTRDSNYQPVYARTPDITEPGSWSRPRNLGEKKDLEKWIDFWVICDEQCAWLFYTRGHRAVYAMECPLTEFPHGFANPREVFAPVHEAVHIYRNTADGRYHMLYETRIRKDIRRFGLAVAKSLGGPWRDVTRDYATGAMLRFPEGVSRWTGEVSHGEMLRVGYDHRLEYDVRESRFLIQGMREEAHTGEYSELTWRLGVIERGGGE